MPTYDWDTTDLEFRAAGPEAYARWQRWRRAQQRAAALGTNLGMQSVLDAFGQMLRTARFQRTYASDKLAQRLGVGVWAVSDVEMGRRPPFEGEVLEACCTTLDVPAEPFRDAVEAAWDVVSLLEKMAAS